MSSFKDVPPNQKKIHLQFVLTSFMLSIAFNDIAFDMIRTILLVDLVEKLQVDEETFSLIKRGLTQPLGFDLRSGSYAKLVFYLLIEVIS